MTYIETYAFTPVVLRARPLRAIGRLAGALLILAISLGALAVNAETSAKMTVAGNVGGAVCGTLGSVMGYADKKVASICLSQSVEELAAVALALDFTPPPYLDEAPALSNSDALAFAAYYIGCAFDATNDAYGWASRLNLNLNDPAEFDAFLLVVQAAVKTCSDGASDAEAIAIGHRVRAKYLGEVAL